MRALLNFARLPDDQAGRLSEALRHRGIEVAGIASHRGEDPDRFGTGIPTAWWHDYRTENAARPWSGPQLEEVLRGDEILSLLPMVERPAPRLGGASEAVWRLRSDLARASDLLERVRPDLLLSLDFPESGLDLFLHRLSASAGIPGLWIRRGLTAFSRIATSDPFAPTLQPDGTVAPTTLDLGGNARAEDRARVERSLEAMTAGRDPDVIPHVRRVWFEEGRIRGTMRRLARRSARYNRWMRARPLLGGRAFLEHLRRDLELHARVPDWSDDRPVCLLALHYQPELSTLTLGSWAVRQLEVAKLLADVLPPDWRLVVKEHPSTFSRGFSKTSATFRPPAFYARVAALPRTTLLPLAADIRPHWDRIAVVATATGTAGSEALAVGCPVIHFGMAPYTNFPGTTWVDAPDPHLLGDAVRGAVGTDRAAVARGFADRIAVVEALSHQNAAGSLQERMVDALVIALDRWEVTSRA